MSDKLTPIAQIGLTIGAYAVSAIPGYGWAAGAAMLAAAGALGAVAARNQESPDLDNYNTGTKLNTRSTEETIKLIYGQVKVGGNDVYIGTSGGSNQYLWIAQTLAEGECDSIAQDGGVDQVWINDELYNTYGGNVEYWFHSGSSTQTYDTNLNTADSSWVDALKNTSYILFKLTYNQNYFQGFPRRTVLLKGKKLYDFRDTSTAYSNNPVLALYDYITDSRYGMGISSAKLDTASWTSAANYCDTKGWTLNIAIGQQQSAREVIDTICTHFRGHLVWYDGKFYLRYSDLAYESSAMTLTDTHIVQDSSGKAMINVSQPSRFKRSDGIRVLYVDPDKEYATDSIMVGDSSGVIKDLQLTGCTDRQQASDLGIYALEREQLDRTITGVFRDNCIKLEPHDLVTFTSSALSISSQTMRVMETAVLEDGKISLSLAYETTTLYNDDYDIDAESVYTTTLPDPNAEPPSVENVSISEETYYYRLRTFTRLKVSLDVPSSYPWLERVEVFLSYDNINWEHLYNVSGDFVLENVEEGQTYYFKLRTVSIFGVKQSDSNTYKISITVTGYTDIPESISALYGSANQNSVNIWADKVGDPDIELYEFRLGNSWSGGIFIASLRSPNLSLSGVKPGSHTFWCNTLSNNDFYGDTARSASVTLQDPPDGWSLSTSYNDDYK